MSENERPAGEPQLIDTSERPQPLPPRDAAPQTGELAPSTPEPLATTPEADLGVGEGEETETITATTQTKLVADQHEVPDQLLREVFGTNWQAYRQMSCEEKKTAIRQALAEKIGDFTHAVPERQVESAATYLERVSNQSDRLSREIAWFNAFDAKILEARRVASFIRTIGGSWVGKQLGHVINRSSTRQAARVLAPGVAVYGAIKGAGLAKNLPFFRNPVMAGVITGTAAFFTVQQLIMGAFNAGANHNLKRDFKYEHGTFLNQFKRSGIGVKAFFSTFKDRRAEARDKGRLRVNGERNDVQELIAGEDYEKIEQIAALLQYKTDQRILSGRLTEEMMNSGEDADFELYLACLQALSGEVLSNSERSDASVQSKIEDYTNQINRVRDYHRIAAFVSVSAGAAIGALAGLAAAQVGLASAPEEQAGRPEAAPEVTPEVGASVAGGSAGGAASLLPHVEPGPLTVEQLEHLRQHSDTLVMEKAFDSLGIADKLDNPRLLAAIEQHNDHVFYTLTGCHLEQLHESEHYVRAIMGEQYLGTDVLHVNDVSGDAPIHYDQLSDGAVTHLDNQLVRLSEHVYRQDGRLFFVDADSQIASNLVTVDNHFAAGGFLDYRADHLVNYCGNELIHELRDQGVVAGDELVHNFVRAHDSDLREVILHALRGPHAQATAQAKEELLNHLQQLTVEFKNQHPDLVAAHQTMVPSAVNERPTPQFFDHELQRGVEQPAEQRALVDQWFGREPTNVVSADQVYGVADAARAQAESLDHPSAVERVMLPNDKPSQPELTLGDDWQQAILNKPSVSPIASSAPQVVERVGRLKIEDMLQPVPAEVSAITIQPSDLAVLTPMQIPIGPDDLEPVAELAN